MWLGDSRIRPTMTGQSKPVLDATKQICMTKAVARCFQTSRSQTAFPTRMDWPGNSRQLTSNSPSRRSISRITPRISPIAPKNSLIAPKNSPIAPKNSLIAPKNSPIAPRTAPLRPRTAPLRPRTAPLRKNSPNAQEQPQCAENSLITRKNSPNGRRVGSVDGVIGVVGRLVGVAARVIRAGLRPTRELDDRLRGVVAADRSILRANGRPWVVGRGIGSRHQQGRTMDEIIIDEDGREVMDTGLVVRRDGPLVVPVCCGGRPARSAGGSQ